ncbi:hypothetical protein ACLOJK_002561 [Asimina triloba]
MIYGKMKHEIDYEAHFEMGATAAESTRNKEVASFADPVSYPHELPLMTPEDSWALFLNRVFLHKRTMIAERCGGLLLAISVVVGLLSTKVQSADAWWEVLSSLNWHLSQQSVHCADVLALSYHDLPNYLKPLWIAEGFIQRRGEEGKEEVAEDCLEELLSRSMIQVSKREYDGRIEHCRVHDLLRDLAISEAGRDQLFQVSGNLLDAPISTLTAVRRLGIHDENSSSSSSLPNVHSFLYFVNSLPRQLVGGAKCKWVRALDLEGVNKLGENEKLTEEMFGSLVHLDLNLRRTGGIPGELTNTRK